MAFPRVRESGTGPTPLARLRPLLEIANLVRDERELEDVLTSIAETIATGIGWRTVVINLYRPAWDDFQVTTVFGNDDARRALLGTTSEWTDWEPLLADRFYRQGTYVVRHGEIDWHEVGPPSFVPVRASADDPDAWDPEDSLLVPLAHAGGRILGILSIDEPNAGRIPTDEELELVAAMAAQAAHAIEQLQRHKETERHRAALEHLHEVSTRLSALGAPEDVLDAVAEGIGHALGFVKVSVQLRRGDGFTPAASCGWDDGGPDILLGVHELEAMLAPRFEIQGCYLVPCEEALAHVSTGSDYESQRNGRGPWAWNRHWLVVPLRNESGKTIGLIWADDPSDRLLPSAGKLQVLRMFANHAVTALELARRWAAEQEANELMRATVTSSPLATIRIDAAGVIRSWNSAAERLYGWSAEEVVGKPYPVDTPARGLEFAHIIAPVLAGESFQGIEVVRETRDGRQIDVSISAAPLRDAEGNVVGAMAVHEDVSGRKWAARELLRSRQELEELRLEMKKGQTSREA